MSWLGLVGHDVIVDRFRRMIRSDRLSSTFLLVGPQGVGKFRFAQLLAQSLFCEQYAEEDLLACGRCPACQQVLSETHPDLAVVRRPADRAYIPLDLIIGDRDHRMREGLISRIAMRPLLGRRKIAIIDDADYLNDEGANSLLKTLEEPPAGSLIVLVGSSEQRQLPTIRSRSQVIRFQPLNEEALRILLSALGVELDAERATEVAQLSFGSLSAALTLVDEQQDAFRRQLWLELSPIKPAWRRLGELITEFVESAGKESAVRRAYLVRVIQWVTLFYRHQLREFDASSTVAERAAERIDRCTEALEQVDANANLATLTDCWLDDLR